jgi:D-alanyl-D-alanine endopeptidase (penicillin-binding protein 7)
MHCATSLQKTLQLAICSVLAAAMLMPLGALAKESKKTSAKQKSSISRSVAKAKPTANKTVVGKSSRKSSRIEARTDKRSIRLAAARETHRLAQAELGRGGRATSARGLSRKEVLAQSRRERVSSRSERSRMTLVAHTRQAPVAALHAMPEPPRLTTGERLGLRGSMDPLELNSSVALVVDQDTNEVLFSKNDSAVLPIASLTKLMTGLVITDANLNMDELITISQDDVDTHKNSHSRLAVGTTLSRGELMHLALMSSENRAAHALGRTYPGGLAQFVRLMNSKAREIGMRDTRYVEPTGLMSENQSSARDLATLVSVAYQRPILRSLSTSPSHQLELGNRTLQFNNSNRLIRNPEWEIGLQKTGYISEAGRCLVMQAKVAGRKLIMVFLDSAGKLSRAQDAERVRRWVEAQTYSPPAIARPQG